MIIHTGWVTRWNQRFRAWLGGPTLGARATLFVLGTVLIGTIPVCFYLGVVPVRRNGSGADHGSFTQAVVNSVLLVVVTAGVVAAAARSRRRGHWHPLSAARRPTYLEWYFANVWRPLVVISGLACARSLTHFKSSPSEFDFRVAFIVCTAGAGVYLYALGPWLRPHTVLSSFRPYDGSETHGSSVHHRPDEGELLLAEYQRVAAMTGEDRIALARQPVLSVDTQLALTLDDNPEVLDALRVRPDLDPAADFYLRDSLKRISNRGSSRLGRRRRST